MRLFRERVIGVVALGIVLVFVFLWVRYFFEENEFFGEEMGDLLVIPARKEMSLRSFSSAEEMKEYIARGESLGNGFSFLAPPTSRMERVNLFDSVGGVTQLVAEEKFSDFSQTNVQVMGIDEPDIVKTDGKSIFVSRSVFPSFVYDEIRPLGESIVESQEKMPREWALEPERGSVRIVETQKKGSMANAGKIESRSGNLLLEKNVLIVFDNKGIFGYDVKDAENPKSIWSIDLKEGDVVDARMVDDQLYFIERTSFNRETVCPFVPLTQGGKEVEVLCSDIYHPYVPVPVSAVYTVMRVNFETGSIEEEKSLVGSYDTAMTLFPGGLYAWYSEQENILEVMYDFFRVNNSLISQEFFLRLEKLRGYEISDQSKTQELFYEIEKYQATLDADDRLKFQNNLENALTQYLEDHKRELTKTHIFKLDLKTLEVKESGYVPGIIHNQFSVDEYEGALRVATTVGTYSGGFGNAPQEENDVLILDKNLDIQGSVQGMGNGERIYSTRFVGDRGYVVTFKQTDPFYVLDLSNPKNPRVTGELKIPGYSSYLHPLPGHRVIGIGKEDNKMKVTLFDASDAENPKEISKNLLNEYWSDILETHHAFTMKPETKIFFLPGSNGGYVFSYADDTLELVKAISGEQIKRSVYIGDIWYFVGQGGIVSYDEMEWKKLGEVKFE